MISFRLLRAVPALAVALAFAACERGFGDAAEPQLVVEGWIDSGGFPVVMLSRTVPITDEYRPTSELADYVERWARVAVADGQREVVLVGRHDADCFPPYVYTTSDLRGEPGHTYRLTVDCTDGTHAEATATIPEPAPIDSFAVEPVAHADSLRQVYAFVGGRRDSCFYKLFTHVLGKPYGYMSAYLGIAEGRMLPADGKMPVNPGRLNIDSDFTPCFEAGDTVMVKLASITEEAYRFWRDFEDMTTLSRNPLFPVTNNLHSNIDGGLGYWFGYGASFATLRVGP